MRVALGGLLFVPKLEVRGVLVEFGVLTGVALE